MNTRSASPLLRPQFLLVVVILSLLALATGSVLSQRPDSLTAAASTLLWDNIESHRWIGEPWGDDASVDWVDFSGRRVLQAVITAEGLNWSLIRTDAFPAEDWEPRRECRKS